MAKWTKNHRMELGIVLAIVGLIITFVSWTYEFTKPDFPSWLATYDAYVFRTEGDLRGDYNLILFIVGPILLIWGGWWVGEQIVLRRRFERLIDTPKRSEFSSRRKELDELSRRLPEGFGRRVKDKETEFVSKRSA